MKTLRRLERPVTLGDIPTAETMRKRQSAPRDFHKELKIIKDNLEEALGEGWKSATVYFRSPGEYREGYYTQLIWMIEARGYKCQGAQVGSTNEYQLDISWE